MKYKYEPAYTGGFSVLDSTKEQDAAFIAQVPTEMKAKMVVNALNSVDGLIVAASAEARPSNCRNRLRDEGEPYPRSGCNHCKTGGLTGCPFEGK